MEKAVSAKCLSGLLRLGEIKGGNKLSQIAKNVVLGSVGAAGLFLTSAAITDASTVHTVVQNDTVWALAQKYGISQEQIEKQNGINSQTHVIYQGQKLTIASEKTPAKAAKTAKTGSYTVKTGDSFWTIAQNSGVSVAQLRAANSLSQNTAIIQPGQVLALPTGAQATTSSVSVTSPVAKETSAPATQSSSTQVGQTTTKPADPQAETKPATTPVQNQSNTAKQQVVPASTPVASEAPTAATQKTAAPQVQETSESTQAASVSPQAPVQSQASQSSTTTKTTTQSQAKEKTTPVAPETTKPVAKPTASTTVSTTSQSTQTSTNSVASSEAAAKEWIAQRESGGSYTAKNGLYYGRYQLTKSYLNGDYSAANQEKVAAQYVTSVYGSWNKAKTFWLANGWY